MSKEENKKAKGDTDSDSEEGKSPSEEKKFDRIINYILITIFIIVIGIVSTALFFAKQDSIETFEIRWSKAMSGESGEGYYMYNSFPFARDDQGLWQTIVSQRFTQDGKLYSRDVTLSMYHDPQSLEGIEISGDILGVLSKDKLYTSFETFNNSMHAIAGVELRKIVGTSSLLIKIPTETAIYGDNPGSYASVSCENATNTTGVVEFRIGDYNSIIEEDNCVVLIGETDEDLLRVADRYVYQIIGIMK